MSEGTTPAENRALIAVILLRMTAVDPLELANQGTYATASRAAALVEPGSRDEVQALVEEANRLRVPLYPVSGGRNWGYGSRVPASGCDGTIVSLHRLDRIVALDVELGLVSVEPGVTFRQLATFLAETRWLAPEIGSSGEASLVGNALERGLLKPPYTEWRIAGVEAMLPTGELIRSDASEAGPSFRELFAQSNLGIVTEMTFTLERRPAWRQRIVFAPGDLAAQLDLLRDLAQRTPRVHVELLNGSRVLTQTGQRTNVAWSGVVTLFADDEAELALWRNAVTNSVANPQCFAPEPVTNGITSDGLRSAYWKKKTFPEDPHPDRDRCGVMWIAPRLPMRGALVHETACTIERIVRAREFEPSMSIRVLHGRSVQLVCGLFYDRDEDGMDERAEAARAAVWQELTPRGIRPYRHAVGSMELPADGHLATRIKRALDPNGILAPGRYIR